MYTPHTHTHRELEHSGQSSQKNVADSAQLKDLQVNSKELTKQRGHKHYINYGVCYFYRYYYFIIIVVIVISLYICIYMCVYIYIYIYICVCVRERERE
jgi:hypothetical protein